MNKLTITDHLFNKQEESNTDLAVERAKEIQQEFQKKLIPKGFFLNEEGLWFQPETEQDDKAIAPIYVCSPLAVTAIVRDHANENHGRLLEFRDVDGHLHSWAMPMEMIAGDGMRIREELLQRGLLINSGRKPRDLLNLYIHQCLPVNRLRCVQQTGWFNNCFVLPEETIGQPKGEKIIYQSFAQPQFKHSQQGSIEDWQKIPQLCCGNSRLIFGLSVAFAAPVLHLLGEENGGFHFRGPSSTGKTTILKVAASVWGGEHYVQRWRTTTNGLEGSAVMHNDALLCLDEIEQMHPMEIGEAAYMLANGSGKGRADKSGLLRNKFLWRLLFISTGEISLANHMQQAGKKTRAGQEVRIIDIPADTGKYGVFEELHGYEHGAAFADALSSLSREFHGTVSRAYLKMLITNQSDIINEMRIIKQKLLQRELPKHATGQVVRVLNRFALVAAAGEIANMHGIVNWGVGEADKAAIQCFHAWLSSRGNSDMQEENVAVAQVRRFFEQHGESRFAPWDTNLVDNKTINRAGFKRKTDGGIEFYVFTEIFRSEMCLGLDHTFVAQVCIRQHLLMPDSDKNPTRSERLPCSRPGGTTRCYRFNPTVLTN